MRTLFLVLFLFTLSSSRRLYRRSEDVDPLLKELFSETKTAPAKDRRDGQTSGQSEEPSHLVNKTSSGSQEKKDDGTSDAPDDIPTESDSGSPDQALPEGDQPVQTSPDSQAEDEKKSGSEESDGEPANIMKPDSKSSVVPTDEKSPGLSGNEAGEEVKNEPAGVAQTSAVASPELSKKKSVEKTKNEHAGDTSAQNSAVASPKLPGKESGEETKNEPAEDTSAQNSAVASPELSRKESGEKTKNEPAGDTSVQNSAVASPKLSGKESGEETKNEPAGDTSAQNSAVASPKLSGKESGEETKNEPAGDTSAQNSAVASPKLSGKESGEETKNEHAGDTSAQNSAVASPKLSGKESEEETKNEPAGDTSAQNAAVASPKLSGKESQEETKNEPAGDTSAQNAAVASPKLSGKESEEETKNEPAGDTSAQNAAVASPKLSGKESGEETKSEHAGDTSSQNSAVDSPELSGKESGEETKNEPAGDTSAQNAAVASPKLSGKESGEETKSEHAGDTSAQNSAVASPKLSGKESGEETKSEHAGDTSAQNSAVDSPELSGKESGEETKNEPAGDTSAQNAAVASPELASVSNAGENPGDETPDVTAAEDQSDQTSAVATASANAPATAAASLPAEELSVPDSPGAKVNSDASQSENSMENTRSDIPEKPMSSDVLPNVVRQSSNDANMRSNIPESPAAVTQPSWSAVNQFPAVPQSGSLGTNEGGAPMKKDSIPAAPSQRGASSYPLQLNKHSPGAELIKRFFIAKKETKKRKEEEAKQKSLIGDGKYIASPNNGFYNYAAAPKVPAPNVNALQENGKEGVCVDKFDSCPEFAKNHYCTDYKTLMKVQCRKSCKYCDIDEDDDDDEDEDSVKSDKQNDDKKEKESEKKVADADEDDEDDVGKIEENEQKHTTKGKKVENDDDDDDDDGDDAKLTSAESKEQLADTSGDAEVNGDSGSGSDKDDQFEKINSESTDKGSGGKDDLPPTAEEFEDENETEKDSGSGSGEEEDDREGDDLAKDLAEQELFSQNVKKDSIPSPSDQGSPSPYPKIDLKDIARYVTLYRSVAKKLFGEALDSAKKEFVVQQSKKSDIPVPIKEKLNSETSDSSSSSLEGFYSSQNQKKRGDVPMKPNNARYTPSDETWANRAYKEAESYLRSKIPEFKNYAPPAMFNYPFYINDPNKTVEETNEGTSSKKSEIPENPEEKYNKTLQDILKRDHINKPSSDPYEYLRDMIPGSSMKPIASKNGVAYIPDSYSRPLQLRTKSQWRDIMAKKKSSIPRVPQQVQANARSSVTSRARPPVPRMQTKPEALAAQATQYKTAVAPEAREVHRSNTAGPSSNSVLPQSGVVRAEIPQPEVPQPEVAQSVQMQQVPSTQSSNFLQSNEAVDQVTNAASTSDDLQSRNKVSKRTEAVSPLDRVDRQAHHHKDSSR